MRSSGSSLKGCAMAAVMAVKSIRQVSQGERLLPPSVANTSQSNGNQKQVAKFSLPMIKKKISNFSAASISQKLQQ